jgi:hypothetical protein
MSDKTEKILKIIPKEYRKDFKNMNLRGHALAIGAVQLGKSSYILYKALYLAVHKINVIIVTNCSLKNQYLERATVIGCPELFKTIWKNKNIPNLLRRARDDIGERLGSIFVIGAHYININALHNAIAEFRADENFFTMIDEGDLYNSPLDMLDRMNKVTKEISRIKDSQYCIGSEVVTATPYSLTYIRDKYPLTTTHVHWIPKTADYISYGHERFEVREIDDIHLMDSKKEIRETLEACIKDARENVNVVRMYINVTENVHEGIINHDVICKILKRINPEAFILTANDSTYILRYKCKETKKQKKIECKSISDALMAYAPFADKELFIVSCKQTGRGHSIRTVSNLGYSTSDIIYANCEVFCCSEGSTTDSVVQQSLRIGGRFPGYDSDDSFKLILYTTPFVINILDKQLEEDEINYKAFKNNPDKQITELIRPTEDKVHKVVSRTRGLYFQKKLKDQYYHTVDSFEKAIEYLDNYQQSESLGDVALKILEILQVDNGEEGPRKLTAEEIYRSGSDWNMTTKTPVDSIRSRCLKLYETGHVKRTTGAVPYKYYVA